jgi:hypothetical protein
MRMAAVVMVAGICATVAGCSSRSPHATNPASIRGAQVAHYACDAKGDGTAIHLPPSSVTSLRLCPLEEPNASTVVITLRPGDASFSSLVQLLAAPDDPPTIAACPGLADVPQPVIADTTSGPLLVHIPVDDCGLYQAAADSALTAARASA